MKDSTNKPIYVEPINLKLYHPYEVSKNPPTLKTDTPMCDIRLHDTWYIDRKRAIADPEIYRMLYGDD
jgi:hypothetical protein